jgi:hypothetical protein
MLVSTMFAVLGPVAAMTLVMQLGSAAVGGASRQEVEPRQSKTEPSRTGKERLGGKSSDEQRIDNCNVPFALRGPKPRPDRCIDDASTSSR